MSIASLLRLFALWLILHNLVVARSIRPLPRHIALDHAKVLLGKQLFFDPILSEDRTISCASCHDLQHGGDDGLRYSIGVHQRQGEINAPTVYNSHFNFRQFWDGRAKDLKAQVYGPITNPKEMNHSMASSVKRLKQERGYLKAFEAIYTEGITSDTIADAIAEFEKALITPNAPFDRYLNGDTHAITPQVKRGYYLFESKGCILCHHGINVGGNSYNKFGIYRDSNSTQLGRYNITHRELDRYLFKVPSLRNVALTAPYMHDGRVDTLEDAVELMAKYQLGRYMEQSEIADIVSFLKSLTGEIPKIAE